MNAVLTSIQPKWVEKIANGEKTIEVRKTAPKCKVPFKCYIYCTKGKPYLYRIDDDNNFELTNTLRPKVDGYVKDYNEQNGKIIGEFICDGIAEFESEFHDDNSTEELRRVWYDEDDGERDAELFAEDGEPNYLCTAACLTWYELKNYVGTGYRTFYGWHISDLKIYDKPKVLEEFYKCGAETLEKLFDKDTLCSYCSATDYGEHRHDISSRWGMVSCEGNWCDEAYEAYLEENFAITRAPQSWQFVESI